MELVDKVNQLRTVYNEYNSFANSGYPDVFNLSDGSATNRFQQFIDGSNRYTTFREVVSNTQQGIASIAAVAGFVRTVSSYSPTGLAFNINGSSTVTSNNAIHASGINKLTIGSNFNGGNPINGTIKKLAYYPKRLSDAELQEMTV